MPQALIRHERPDDLREVHEVNRLAFDRPGGAVEADLVDALRRNGRVLISLVAELDGRVVGHALFCPITIESPGSTATAIALGTLAVHPDNQRRGVGSQLVEAGIEACRQLGHRSIFVLGHRTYYPRFGFVPARPFGIIYDDGRDSFQVVELTEGALSGLRGTVRYPPEYEQFS